MLTTPIMNSDSQIEVFQPINLTVFSKKVSPRVPPIENRYRQILRVAIVRSGL